MLSRSSRDQSGTASKSASQATTDNDEARQRFGNAKSISSSMFDEDANKGNDYEKQAMLSKFSVCLLGSCQPGFVVMPAADWVPPQAWCDDCCSVFCWCASGRLALCVNLLWLPRIVSGNSQAAGAACINHPPAYHPPA